MHLEEYLTQSPTNETIKNLGHLIPSFNTIEDDIKNRLIEFAKKITKRRKTFDNNLAYFIQVPTLEAKYDIAKYEFKRRYDRHFDFEILNGFLDTAASSPAFSHEQQEIFRKMIEEIKIDEFLREITLSGSEPTNAKRQIAIKKLTNFLGSKIYNSDLIFDKVVVLFNYFKESQSYTDFLPIISAAILSDIQFSPLKKEQLLSYKSQSEELIEPTSAEIEKALRIHLRDPTNCDEAVARLTSIISSPKATLKDRAFLWDSLTFIAIHPDFFVRSLAIELMTIARDNQLFTVNQINRLGIWVDNKGAMDRMWQYGIDDDGGDDDDDDDDDDVDIFGFYENSDIYL